MSDAHGFDCRECDRVVTGTDRRAVIAAVREHEREHRGHVMEEMRLPDG